jgi:hypothetical protein
MVKTVKLAGKEGSADLEPTEEFLKYLKSIVQGRCMWKNRFSTLTRLTCLERTVNWAGDIAH